jgi:hypothetical protein
MQWKHPSSTATKKFKIQPSTGKMMLMVFWDYKGSILQHYQECRTTLTSAMYSDMLQNELRPAICTDWQGRLSEGVLILHDNARPHTAAHTRETLR